MEIIKCTHCNETGVCRADNENSCGTCLKDARINSESKVVRCAVCEGTRIVNIRIVRLSDTIPTFIVAIVLCTFYFGAALAMSKGDLPREVFTAVVSLTTMIVTFYFSRPKEPNRKINKDI